MLLACDPGGLTASIGERRLREAREALHAGAPFAETIAACGLRLDSRALQPYSNWVTPENEPLRFDTLFFIAQAPSDQAAQADAREVHDGRWLTPAGALAQARANQLTIVFPTLKHLERLRAFASPAAALAAARSRAFVPLTPVVNADGEILIGGDTW